MVVVDTSVVIDFLRQKNSANTWLKRLVTAGYQLVLPMPVVAELYSGKSVWSSRKARERLDGLVVLTRLIPMNQSTAITAGKLRATLDINLADASIAAIALDNSLPIATLDRKHMSKIKELMLLESK